MVQIVLGLGWQPRGEIVGTSAWKLLSGGFSLSNDGKRVTIASVGVGVGGGADTYKGYAQAFYNENPASTAGPWRSIGVKITSDDHGRTGWRNAIGLSGDGNRIVIGIPASGIPTGTPKVKILDISSSNPNSCAITSKCVCSGWSCWG